MALKSAIAILLCALSTGAIAGPGRTHYEPGYFLKFSEADARAFAALPDKALVPLPPPEYDKPYNGRLLVIDVETTAEFTGLCGIDPAFIYIASACAGIGLTAKKFGQNVDCVIVLAPETIFARIGATRTLALRHELAHCNGWPADHPGARSAMGESEF